MFLVIVVVGALVGHHDRAQVRVTLAKVRVSDGPRLQSHVRLDTATYVPATATKAHPAPAIILAHGFGGSRHDLASRARELAGRGYVVLAFSARGFGNSTGEIALDSADYEVRDVEQLIDRLARRNDVILDKIGDPRVGIIGASYGGAIALQVAARDARVDAIVPVIAWNDLGASLAPNSATAVTSGDAQPRGQTPAWSPPLDATTSGSDGSGVFKRAWAGALFAAGAPKQQRDATVCGNFTRALCTAYTASAEAGQLTPATRDLLAMSSPSQAHLERTKAAVMLVQGETDSLFPPSEGDRTIRQLASARHHAPLKVVWQSAGHDGGATKDDSRWVRHRTYDWLERYLWKHTSVDTGPGWEFARPGRTHRGSVDGYPGIDGRPAVPRRMLALHGRARTIVNPAGGAPAALSTLPGAADVATLAAGVAGELRGQHVNFDTRALTRRVDALGSSQVRVTISSPSGARDVTLFAKLYDVGTGSAQPELPQRLAAPIRIALPAGPSTRTVLVALPAISHRFEVGHKLRVTFSTTDQAYAATAMPARIRIALAGDRRLAVPLAPAGAIDTGERSTAGIATLTILALLALIGLASSLVARRRRNRLGHALLDASAPLEFVGLTKTWGDGLRAVDDLSFRVERGQVLGLLGPNGAGKTTALRMAMGLIRPDAGHVRVLGQLVGPGAAVLGKVGSFVEGSGFLPHLSGRANLELYWASSGRTAADAHVDEALEVAALGRAIDKPVRTYSQGMRQRLAIAQAMLGLPDLLVLDEPTNGLDPPQIREMRDVIRGVAASGRTVIVSSHLLAEVEQTCTHVVVMQQGRLVASGPVAEILSHATGSSLEDAFMELVAADRAPGGTTP